MAKNKLFIILSKIIPFVLLGVSLIGIPYSIYQYSIGKLSITYIYLFSIATITIITYFLFDWYVQKNNNSIDKTEVQTIIHSSKYPHMRTIAIRIFDICFYLGLAGLLLYIYNCTERSIPYVLLLGVLAVLIIAPVFLSEKKTVCSHALLKCIILVITTSLSIFKIFWWTGRDTWTHAAWSMQVVDIGGISQNLLGAYYNTPLLHIENAITQIIPGFDVRLAAIFSVTIPLLILFSLGIFIVTRDIFGNRFAILAVLIADFIGIIPFWATWAQSTTLACLFFAVLLIPLFKIIQHKDDRLAWIFLFVTFSIVLMLTHLYSSFIYILFLFGVVLVYLLVDAGKKKQMRKVNNMPIIISVIGVMILVGVYHILRNISLIKDVFSVGFSQLGSRLTNNSEVLTPDVSLITTVSSSQSIPLSNNAAIVDPSQITTMLNSCFTLVGNNEVVGILTTFLSLTLLMVPLLLGLLFVVKHYLVPENQKKRRELLYLLIPGLMIFLLFVITYYAYLPMIDRPQYYIPIFSGILLAGIIWHYVTTKGIKIHISKKSFVTILVIVFLVVSLGSVCTLEEKPGEWKLKSTTSGHSVQEVIGLQTISRFLSHDSSLYSDYDSVRFTTKLSGISNTIKKDALLKFTPDRTIQQYVIFRTPLLSGTTCDYIQTGSSELSRICGIFQINSQYPVILDNGENRIFDGGEMVEYYII